MKNNDKQQNQAGKINFYQKLEESVLQVLRTYSNVHRGSGLFSQVTTNLYDRSRDIVLDYFHLNKGSWTVVFCTARRAEMLTARLGKYRYKMVSGKDIGLAIGVYALAVKKSSLPGGAPVESGGGTTRLVAQHWVLWAKTPDRFEAGTPAIVNVIVFACALQLVKKYGKQIVDAEEHGQNHAGEIIYNDEFEHYSGMELLEKLRNSVTGKDIQVPSIYGQRPFINLDNAASTPAFEPVYKAFCGALQQSQKRQHQIIREVRENCSTMFGAPHEDYEIVFTSNTTEAINIAADSFSREEKNGSEPVVLTSMLEHSANDLPWRRVSADPLIRLTINYKGFISLEELEQTLRSYNKENQHGPKRIRLVAVCAASNTLGNYNDLAAISEIVHAYGARLLVDAAQLVAHRTVDMSKTGIDYLAFSGHKVYAPFGCGMLIVRKGILQFTAQEMEKMMASGEENAAGIAALGKSLELLHRIGWEITGKREHELTARLLRGMKTVSGVKVFGVDDPESDDFSKRGGVFVFTMEKAFANMLAKKLAVRGIGIRYGCHCAHILVKHMLGVSPKLEKFQKLMLTVIPTVQLPGIARVSLGIQNTEEEIDALVKALQEISTEVNNAGSRLNTVQKKFSDDEVKQQMREYIRNVELIIFPAN